MSKFDDIFHSIEGDIEGFKRRYKEIVSDGKVSKSDFVNYIVKIEGKGIRPILLFLAAHLHGKVNEDTINSAVILELTHTASLIHDDVVDEAFQRRGNYSINALWRSKKAVLIGDYIFSKAISTASKNGLYDVLGSVAKVIEDMSVAELDQSDASLKLNITEARYFEVIRGKTASLMSSSARLGAASVGASKEDCENIAKLGELIGIMFQVKDDMLDFDSSKTGKNAGNDLKEGKITLPLIYALKRGEKKEVNDILRLLRSRNEKKDYIKKITHYVVEKGGLDIAQKRVEMIGDEAKALLAKYPESEYKRAFVNLIDFLIVRNK